MKENQLRKIVAEVCDGYTETINLVYALDVRKPIYKIFKAYKDRKTGNLFAFNSQWINVYELKPNEEFVDFEPIVKHLLELTDDSSKRFENLEKNVVSSETEERQQFLGELIENSMNNDNDKETKESFIEVFICEECKNYICLDCIMKEDKERNSLIEK